MQTQMEIVTKLGPYDVLFGRGSGPNDHEGNVRFRKLVAERKSEYMATNHRMTKAKIAREIVDAVLRENGRFLKKIEPEDARTLGIPEGVEAWTGVDDDTIMEKAKQALRQNTNKNKERGKSPPRVAVVTGATPVLSQQTLLQQQQQQQNLPTSTIGQNLGYMGAGVSGGGSGVDLEPIPIPSSQYPTATGVLLDPTPVREVGQQQTDMQPWGGGAGVGGMGVGGNNGVKPQPPIPQQQQQQQPMQPSAYGGYNDQPSPRFNPVLPTGVQQQQQQQQPISPQTKMQPPAARAPSIRSSLNSNAGRPVHEKSMEMGDLMVDSFSKITLGGNNPDIQRDMGNSIETMGTIEPMSMGSEANMSYATVNSSMFSILRPDDDNNKGGGRDDDDDGGAAAFRRANERSFSELEQEEPPSYIQAYKNPQQLPSDFLSSTRMGLASDASMSITDLGGRVGNSSLNNSGGGNNSGGNKRQPSSVALKEVKKEGYRQVYDSVLGEVDPENPYGDSSNVGGIEDMGSSSLNLLKGMLMSQDELPPGAPPPGAGAGGDQQRSSEQQK